MGMFDQIKDMTKMKQMADDAKKQAESLRATGKSKRGYVTITLDGEKHLKKVEFAEGTENVSRDELAKLVKDAHRMAAKEIDKMLKKQMKNSGLANMFMGK